MPQNNRKVGKVAVDMRQQFADREQFSSYAYARGGKKIAAYTDCLLQR